MWVRVCVRMLVEVEEVYMCEWGIKLLSQRSKMMEIWEKCAFRE
jgi:hypothetical protein